MATINLGNSCKWTTLLTLTAGLVGGCASYPSGEAPPDEAMRPAAAAATPSHAPAGPVQPAALSVPPPPLAKGYTDKGVNASYLTTAEYEEALEYQAALERYLTDPFIVANHLATERLLRDSQVDVASYGRVAVAPFADLDRPGQVRHLGQMIGGQIATRLTQLGYPVAEADSGYNARAVVAGHYVISQDRIFVSARLIDATANNRVVSVYDYALPLDKTTLGLVTGCFKQGQWICRLP